MRTPEPLHATAALANRLVVLAPLGRDAAVICTALAASAIDCVTAQDIDELAARVDEGAGAVLITEEVLTQRSVDAMCETLARQPSWSDLPVLLLLGEGERPVAQASRRIAAMRAAANVTVLVRPIQGIALLTVVQAALRARARQYEVGDLIQRERTARIEADEANRLKDEFLATVSHELRTPLNAILLWSRLLATGRVQQQEVSEAIAAIERSARSQSRLVEDLLDVSRMVSGRLRLNVKDTELAPVAQEALAVVRPMADAKNIRLESIIDPAAGRVFADADRMQQVLWNLLGNAVKFTPAGGRVSMDLRRQGQHVAIRIEDSGEGIAPEFLPQVFDRFRQADAESSRRHGGLGLGLAITQELVELHGGSVDVESAGRGMGSTFTVRIPLARRDAGIGDAATPRLDGFRVLLVEDESATRAGVTLVLEHAGAEVIATTSARGALDALQERVASDQLPDLLLSDIGLPGEDGHALMRAVRLLPNRARSIPALAISAYPGTDHRERALQSGFQDYLVKPVDPGFLLDAVLQLAGTAGTRTGEVRTLPTPRMATRS